MRPTEPSEADTLATWGDLFEVAAKRGCLDQLLQRGLLPDEAHLAPWAEAQVGDLTLHLLGQLGVTDPAARERYARALQHLLLQGWGLGWTVLRSALDRLGSQDLRVLGLYCPLSLPERPALEQQTDEPDAHAHEALWQALHLPGKSDPAWLGKGQPARADFLLWLRDSDGRQHIFVLEFSLSAKLDVRDYRDPEPHLDEVLAHASRLESRGIFTRIGASLTSDEFVFSDRIVSHLAALTTSDKPLYKLAQASAYATSFLDNLRERGLPITPATAHAIAITNQGVEALKAELAEQGSPRWALMQALGAAYPRVRRPGDDDRQALDREIEAVRGQIVRALPAALRDAVDAALDLAVPGRGLDLRLGETVEGFANPAAPVDWEHLAAGVEESPAVCQLLGSPQPRVSLAEDCDFAPEVTLREIHAATLRRVIRSAPAGQITVLAAEGLPGIGKTTSVRRALQGQPGGFLWLYASPRLVINEDVLRAVASPEDGAPDVVALTTNSRLIGGAAAWWRDHHRKPAGQRRRVDGAVLCQGASLPVIPQGSTLFVGPEQAAEIDGKYSGSTLQKRNLDEGTDEMRQALVNGVLSTLASAAREVLERNPGVNRLALTASVQGFRQVARADPRRSARTTVERLSGLFHERVGTPAGFVERRELARRIPTVVVMVDEIAGDGAGAPFVHELGAWLHRELIAPFADVGETSPFRVVLVLSDASLANDAVLRSYLEHGQGGGEAPEKVIVSPSRGAIPFRVTAGDLRIGGRLYPALHVMADGFPARKLAIDYRLQLTPVVRDARARREGTAARLLVARQEGDRILHGAVQCLFDALGTLPPGEQLIFFAQDKLLLREVRAALLRPEAAISDDLPPIETHGVHLAESAVAILDSSIPDAERKRLTEPGVRDQKRVFLMTSSGARGVSFPRASTIVGLVPRFAVEGGFMELAQLAYRGRGAGGDLLDRRLVFLLQDFVVVDDADGPKGTVDERQWLRRTLDVLSALLLLRATIYTRVTGDAGLPAQRASIVPVGRVGADEVASSLSQAVGPFLREGSLYLREGADAALRGLVESATRGVEELFRDLDQSAALVDGRASVTQSEWVERLTRQVTAAHARLLNREHPPALPEHVFAAGPVWLESWRGLSVEESFAFPGRRADELKRTHELRSRLYRIGEQYRQLPRALCRSARELASLLSRPEGLRDRGFRVKRDLEGARLWVCLPLDYPAFGFVEGEHGREARRLDEDSQPLWRDALLRVVSAECPVLAWDPAIPRYAARPFLTFQTTGEPSGLERAFDGRYFMASTELNLLNTILFVAPADAAY